MVEKNFVSLTGKIKYASFTVLENDLAMFKCKINGINITAWGDTADDLNRIDKSLLIKIHGRINTRSYDSNCKFCKAPQKLYWTDVTVDNFMVLE